MPDHRLLAHDAAGILAKPCPKCLRTKCGDGCDCDCRKRSTLAQRRHLERERARLILTTIRAACEGVELALQLSEHAPIGNEAAQAMTQEAIRLATTLAKLDAYFFAERGDG